MNVFEISKTFDDFKSVLAAKGEYEKASNSILTVETSHLLQGEGEFVLSKKYERITYNCKAGKERPSQSKGIRVSSTYKANCPFKVGLKLIDGKFVVTQSILIHENHDTDEQTFLSYPENVRLSTSEAAAATKLIEAGGKKQRIKAMLSKERDAPVPLKVLYNLDTKIRIQKQTHSPQEDFQEMIKMMETVPNSRVRVITNDQKEFVGLYFQDERMAHMYEKYPEIIFYDATHNLNKKKFPLFIQLCIDGNGNSEIVSLFLCVSESRQGVGSMIDVFKEMNASWPKTKVILGDKDFADRDVYSEKFVNAVLKLCIFHVQRTFRREITTHKRNISAAQRDQVLSILQRILYSCSSEEYETSYNELVDLKLELVTKYYNENWHGIREEWTLFGLNEHCSYMNTTNNRMESLNQKLKLVGSRNANLQGFFENLSISISSLSSEKDLVAVRGKMRRSRQRFDDSVLQRYMDFLTPFAFSKVEIQYELAQTVEFTFIEDGEAIVNNRRVDIVSTTNCSCLFFSSMKLPCRHILSILKVVDVDVFAPELCATRWTKAYFEASHPALLEGKPNHTKAVYTRVRNQDDVDRHNKSSAVAKEVKNFVFGLSTAEQTLFLRKMKNFPDTSNPSCAVESLQQSDLNEASDVPLDLSIAKPSDLNSVEGSVSFSKPTSTTTNAQLHIDDNNEIVEPPVKRSLLTNIQNGMPSSRNVPVTVLSSIENIVIPNNNKPVGRPKGSSLTAIGTKAKRKKCEQKTNLSRRIADGGTSGNSQKFCDKSSQQQAVTLIEWLTKTSGERGSKVSSKELVDDANVFNRLRNNEVVLDNLKELVDDDCFKFLHNKLSTVKDTPWTCSKCKSLLSDYQVRCDFCLDWFHFECVRYKKTNNFVCSTCN